MFTREKRTKLTALMIIAGAAVSAWGVTVLKKRNVNPAASSSIADKPSVDTSQAGDERHPTGPNLELPTTNMGDAELYTPHPLGQSGLSLPVRVSIPESPGVSQHEDRVFVEVRSDKQSTATRRFHGSGDVASQTIQLPIDSLMQALNVPSSSNQMVFFARTGFTNGGTDVLEKTWHKVILRSLAEISNPQQVQITLNPRFNSTTQALTPETSHPWLPSAKGPSNEEDISLKALTATTVLPIFHKLQKFNARISLLDAGQHDASQDDSIFVVSDQAIIAEVVDPYQKASPRFLDYLAKMTNAEIVYRGRADDFLSTWAGTEHGLQVPTRAWKLKSWVIFNGVYGQREFIAHPEFAAQYDLVARYLKETAVAIFAQAVEIKSFRVKIRRREVASEVAH